MNCIQLASLLTNHITSTVKHTHILLVHIVSPEKLSPTFYMIIKQLNPNRKFT